MRFGTELGGQLCPFARTSTLPHGCWASPQLSPVNFWHLHGSLGGFATKMGQRNGKWGRRKTGEQQQGGGGGERKKVAAWEAVPAGEWGGEENEELGWLSCPPCCFLSHI